MRSASQIRPQQMVRRMYRRLARAWGPQHWWPAETAFEVVVGAILTQNTSWTNVERALKQLRAAERLNVAGIRELPLAELEQLIRSSGYYRQKADRLKRFVAFLDDRYNGSLETLFATATDQLRGELLSIKGIGAETADAILLYGGSHEIFVVDSYARRILLRHEAIAANASYDEIRRLVESALQREQVGNPGASSPPAALVIHEPSPVSRGRRTTLSQVYNEMHGLLVQVGKNYCTKVQPDCAHCPLLSLLPSPSFKAVGE